MRHIFLYNRFWLFIIGMMFVFLPINDVFADDLFIADSVSANNALANNVSVVDDALANNALANNALANNALANNALANNALANNALANDVLMAVDEFSNNVSVANYALADNVFSTNDSDTISELRRFLSLQASANLSYLIHHGPDIQEVLHSYGTSFFDIRLKSQCSPNIYAPYDRALNYPTLQVGLQYGDFSHAHIYRAETPYESRIGYMLALYGGIQVPFLRTGRWTFGTDLQNGVAYCPHPYDGNNNVDNEIIGSTLTIYVNLGLFARYRLSPHWSLSLGADFKHFSNGTLDRPNIGINAIGSTLALSYDIQPQPLRNIKHKRIIGDADGQKRGFYVEAVAGLGMKALFDDFTVNHSKHNSIYGFFTCMVAPMYRYHLLHASGIGFDYSYADYVYKNREYDQILHRPEMEYSPHVMGVSLRHEIFYRHLSVNVGVGVYIHSKQGYLMDYESRCYQNVSLRYSLPFTSDRVFIGYNIKAHRFQKVDCVQLMAGYRIGW